MRSSPTAARRHPLAGAAVILLALLTIGAIYTVLTPGRPQAAATEDSAALVEEGRTLFLANCSTCHGLNGQGSTDGPSLAGVGAASVDFQVGTGRMPAYTADIHQVPQVDTLFTQEEINAMAAYVASLGPGPAIPTEEQYTVEEVEPEEIAEGGELFLTNCAMCHNASGAGGALTGGKYAPSLHGVEPRYIYEAMLTGPQSMPVFGETLPEEEKRLIIAYLQSLEEQPPYGGFELGGVGPVSEGLVAWVGGIGALIAFAVWLGQKSS